VQLPITIGLRRSRFLDVFIALSALLASGAVLAFSRSTLIQATILSSTFLLGALALRRMRLPILAVRLEQSGDISLWLTADNEFHAAEILPGATVHPWLTVLRLKTDNELPQMLIVTVDSLNALDFRRLRVFLRWRANFSEMNDDV
jgi:toxin CptA